jgi:hypothetical protein
MGLRPRWLVAVAAMGASPAAFGCSLLTPLDELDDGADATTGSGAASPSSATAATSTGSGGAAGGPSAAGGTGGIGGGVAAGPGGGAGSCAPTQLCSLQDAFDEVDIGAQWLTYAGCTISQSNGEAVHELVSAPGSNFCGYISVATYDMTSDAIAIEVTQTVAPVEGPQQFLGVKIDTMQVIVVLEDGSLSLRTRTENIGAGAYSPTDDRWWKLREAAGQILFETSPDGSTWTLRADMPVPFDITAVHGQFGAGTYVEVTNPGIAAFDCLNLVGNCP